MRYFIFSCFVVLLGQVAAQTTRVDSGDELLRITDSEGFVHFGSSVDISGNTIVVGTGEWVPDHDPDDPSDDSRTRWCANRRPISPEEVSSREEVFVFDYTTGGQPVRTLRADTSEEGNWFGMSVAVDGDLAIIGAPLEDVVGEDSGAAYLFDVTTGQQLFKFVADDALPFDRFGNAVAIHGNRAVVASRCAGAEKVQKRCRKGVRNRFLTESLRSSRFRTWEDRNGQPMVG